MSEGGPYSVEVCVAKRKQGQLALLSLTEEKMAVVTKLNINIHMQRKL